MKIGEPEQWPGGLRSQSTENAERPVAWRSQVTVFAGLVNDEKSGRDRRCDLEGRP